MRDTGSRALQSSFLGLLAEAYLKDGQVEEGLATVAEALAFVDRTEERFYEAELYRLRGELTLAQSGVRSPESEVPKSQIPDPKRKPKRASTKRLRLPRDSRQNHWSCAQ